MAIEGIAAMAAAKELAAKAAVEAAKQIAQKMANEVSAKGVESQTIDLERQVAQEEFRVGEMNQPGAEELIASRAGQEQVCNDLAQKLTDAPEDGELSRETKDCDSMPDVVETDREVGPVEVAMPRQEVNETPKSGGTYGELKGQWGGNLENGDPPQEIHHMPANSVNGLETADGPAIVMEKGDHQETASWGNSREAREYRARQAELVKQGKFEEAMQMDIDDIHDKFGSKYDDAIAQMTDVAKEKGLI
jgi:hypothetical protein